MASPLVFIDGQYGTTGLQIHDRLGTRSDLRLLSLPAAERKNALRRTEALNACDIAILCLPDAAAVEAVSFIANPAVRVIDASSAHRTHPDWTYGFAEMTEGQARRIAAARRVTNPGCYPTGAIALLRPLVQAGLIPANYPLSINAVSGYSGGGRAAVERYEQQSGAPDFEVYGLGLAHKHPPEIRHYAGLAQRPQFLPAYGAFRQGIVLTIPLLQALLPTGTDAARLHGCLATHYRTAEYVRVMALDESLALDRLDPQALNGSNDLLLGVCADPAEEQLLLFAVFDNLGKGAAGAAVQNLDLMFAQR